jgi:hypothetical protein
MKALLSKTEIKNDLEREKDKKEAEKTDGKESQVDGSEKIQRKGKKN